MTVQAVRASSSIEGAIGNTPLLPARLCSGRFACHNVPCRRSHLHAPDRHLPTPHPARLILIASLAPTVGLGIGRFAYALVLPDMRDSLGWSYSAAGFLNTINAAGYLDFSRELESKQARQSAEVRLRGSSDRGMGRLLAVEAAPPAPGGAA